MGRWCFSEARTEEWGPGRVGVGTKKEKKKKMNPQESRPTENVGEAAENEEKKKKKNQGGELCAVSGTGPPGRRSLSPSVAPACSRRRTFCLLHHDASLIPLFSAHLFTRRKAHSDGVVPPHNKK